MVKRDVCPCCRGSGHIEVNVSTNVRPTVRDYLTETCRTFDFHPNAVISQSRRADLVLMRDIVALLASNGGFSNHHIAEILGGRDASTVSVSKRRAADRIKWDAQFRETVVTVYNRARERRAVVVATERQQGARV